MNRHHLLSLLDKLQEKYQFQDEEYKEFAEAIGGKNKPLDLTKANFVKVEYDHIEARVDYDGCDMFPDITIREKCSRIWNIIDSEITGGKQDCLISSNIRRWIIEQMAEDMVNEKMTSMSLDTDNEICHYFRVKSIEVLSFGEP